MNTTALKHDTGKPRIDLIPPKAIIAIARIFTFGAAKYGDYNWRSGGGLNHSRLFAAIMRHLLAWWDGEDNDPESGEPHLAHAACSVTMLLSGCGVDDRPGMPVQRDPEKELCDALSGFYFHTPTKDDEDYAKFRRIVCITENNEIKWAYFYHGWREYPNTVIHEPIRVARVYHPEDEHIQDEQRLS